MMSLSVEKPDSNINLGSLLRLFKSEHFDAWMAMSYLYRHCKNSGVFSYLCNECYKLDDDDIEFYLAQICSLVVWNPHESQPLFGFLMDKACKSVHFAIKIAWMFSALTEPRDEVIVDRCATLRRETEHAMMNRRRPDRHPDEEMSLIQSETQKEETISRSPSELMIAYAQAKKERCDYFKAIQSFVESLGAISDRLRSVPFDERNASLKTELMELNKNLIQTPGLYIPLASSSSPHCCLVNIPPEECVLLNSRERAPYLIIVEVLESDIPSSSESLHQYAKQYRKTYEMINSDQGKVRLNLSDIFDKQASEDSLSDSTRENPTKKKKKRKNTENSLRERTSLKSSSKGTDNPPENKNNSTDKTDQYNITPDLAVQRTAAVDDRKIDISGPENRFENPGPENRKSDISGPENRKSDISGPENKKTDCSISISEPENLKTDFSVPENDIDRSRIIPDVVVQEMKGLNHKSDFSGLEIDMDRVRTDDELVGLDTRKKKNHRKKSKSPRLAMSEKQSGSLRNRRSRDVSPHRSKGPLSVPPADPSGLSSPDRLRINSVDDWVILESPENEKKATNPEEEGVPSKKRPQSILFLREKWEEKEARIRINSPFGHLLNWKLQSLIVKYGDDCRQERMALQLIKQFHKILSAAKLPLYLRPYKILVLSHESCLIETVTNAMSIHQLKKEHNAITIGDYFRLKCDGVDSQEYRLAQANFVESTAAYSIVTYLLQLKDRHNGNIMIDLEGHVIHIDFGFMLSNSPGSLNFETSPFKLTQEYIDFMGGLESAKFQYFKVLVTSGFMEVRKYFDRVVGLVEMMLQTGTKLPCLVAGPRVVEELRDRFMLGCTEQECHENIHGLIMQSANNWRTQKYDQYQFLTNGILH